MHLAGFDQPRAVGEFVDRRVADRADVHLQEVWWLRDGEDLVERTGERSMTATPEAIRIAELNRKAKRTRLIAELRRRSLRSSDQVKPWLGVVWEANGMPFGFQALRTTLPAKGPVRHR